MMVLSGAKTASAPFFLVSISSVPRSILQQLNILGELSGVLVEVFIGSKLGGIDKDARNNEIVVLTSLERKMSHPDTRRQRTELSNETRDIPAESSSYGPHARHPWWEQSRQWGICRSSCRSRRSTRCEDCEPQEWSSTYREKEKSDMIPGRMKTRTYTIGEDLLQVERNLRVTALNICQEQGSYKELKKRLFYWLF